MKKQIIAVFGLLIFSCAAFAQPAPVSAELNPIKNAALKASQTLPQEYSFSDLYQAVEKILEENAQSILDSASNFLAKQHPCLQGTEEFAVMRLSENMMARSSYKRVQKRNQELLQAFEQAGKILEKDGVVFDASNSKHMFLVQTQLNKMREAAKKQKAQRAQARMQMWLEGLQNISKYGLK